MFVLLIALLLLWLEITATSLPLFLIGVLIMIILYSTKHDVLVFSFAFLGGLILDVSVVRFLGGTSLYLVCWLFLVLLYERKYEINTIPFVFVSSFFGVFLYLWLFGYEDIFILSITGSFLSGVLFIIFRRMGIFHKNNLQYDNI